MLNIHSEAVVSNVHGNIHGNVRFETGELIAILPCYTILKYLGNRNKCHIYKYLGYDTDEGPYYFESEDERNKTLEEEMTRY